ncbi:uncharacterized protein LOC133133950 isoform X2 [Conger conger]|nr:uncharacterized protein LOC133133950 isoform X2 [Conger conger]
MPDSMEKVATPVVTPSKLVGNITANTAILLSPLCYFENVNCTLDTCVIYLVPAINSGVQNFDKDKTSSNILSLSPYPIAFSNQRSKNYFLTKVGPLENFKCKNVSATKDFRVGSDGNCSDPNCNGVLPTGSNVSFKYIVVKDSLPNVTILQESGWSNPISLVSPKSFVSINDDLAERSPSMIAITVILSIILFLLLLMLILALVYGHIHESEPMPVLGSLRVQKYNTHHLRDPIPHVNVSFEGDLKKNANVLPNLSSAVDNVDPQNTLTLRRFRNYELYEGDS